MGDCLAVPLGLTVAKVGERRGRSDRSSEKNALGDAGRRPVAIVVLYRPDVAGDKTIVCPIVVRGVAPGVIRLAIPRKDT